MRRAIRRGAGAALLLAVLWACGGEPSEYRRFESADGRFAVVVLREGGAGASAPGQSGDAPGVVQLVDAEGTVLQEAPVEMVQLVDTVNWREDRVEVKLVADWPLPTP